MKLKERGKKMDNIKKVINILKEGWDFDDEKIKFLEEELKDIKKGDVVNFDNDRWDMDLNISYESDEEWESLKEDYKENFDDVEIDGDVISGDCWVSIRV